MKLTPCEFSHHLSNIRLDPLFSMSISVLHQRTTSVDVNVETKADESQKTHA